MNKNWKLETLAVQAGYTPGDGDARIAPIVQSTTYKYDNAQSVADLFDLKKAGFFYTRLANPTVDAFEKKLTELDGGVLGIATASGMSATLLAILNIAGAGDNIVASRAIYGGSYNLFAVTMKRMGIEFTFVEPDCCDAELEAAFRPNTKAVFGETIANPALIVLDIERFAKAAHAHGVPLIVDNTFLSPYFQNPIALGADLVVHSGTKYLGGHNDTISGFVCLKDRELGEKLHKISYTMGATLSPFDSWLMLRGIKTLAVRMERAQENALPLNYCSMLFPIALSLLPWLSSGWAILRKRPYASMDNSTPHAKPNANQSYNGCYKDSMLSQTLWKTLRIILK